MKCGEEKHKVVVVKYEMGGGQNWNVADRDKNGWWSEMRWVVVRMEMGGGQN